MFEEFGIVNEYLFEPQNGDMFTPGLATSWSFNADGTEMTFQIRQGVEWQSPRGLEHLDLGLLTAQDVARVMNLNNKDLNPGGFPVTPMQNWYGEARSEGDETVHLEVSGPLGFPIALSASSPMQIQGLGIYYTGSIASQGLDWAQAHPVGTGPFTQGECIQNEACSFHAVSEHWRVVPDIDTFTLIRADLRSGDDVAYAMLRNGVADASQFFRYSQVDEILTGGLRKIHSHGDYIGHSILWAGNYWEEVHGSEDWDLNPWDSGAYDRDFPWIGDPWQEIYPEKVRYTDTDNPPGMTDMEQARLVRLALDTALDRSSFVEDLFNGYGTPLYNEYMGPHYYGWDAGRESGVWTFDGVRIQATDSQQAVPWALSDSNLDEADRLLTLAGYPLVNGKRESFGTDLLLVSYVAEFGQDSLLLGPPILETWSKLGIEAGFFEEDYSGVISPVLRSRNAIFPIVKNGDVARSSYPLDAPYPIADTSLNRGVDRNGLNFGFESPFLAQQHLAILASSDRVFREQQHLQVADYMTYWRLYGGLVQLPVSVIVTERTESWFDPRMKQKGQNVYARPEFLKLKR
jgi:ABC-type transport system substrate-binding protein